LIFYFLRKPEIDNTQFTTTQPVKQMTTPTQTHITTFNDGVSSFLVSSVLTPLASWLATNKGCQCSVDEMMAALKVAAPAKTTGFPQAGNVPVQLPNIPGFATTAAPARGKRTQAVAHNGPTCRYQFARGAKRGQSCGEPCVELSPGQFADFCKSCIKKKAAQNAAGGGATTTTTAAQGAAQNGQAELQVVPIKDKPGYFKSVGTNFIIRQLDDGAVIAIAVEVDGGATRPLTAAEKDMAEKMGVGVRTDEEDAAEQEQEKVKTTPTPVQTVPNVPKIPTLAGLQAGLPAVPQAGRS
jgi:hypothetical protein